MGYKNRTTTYLDQSINTYQHQHTHIYIYICIYIHTYQSIELVISHNYTNPNHHVYIQLVSGGHCPYHPVAIATVIAVVFADLQYWTLSPVVGCRIKPCCFVCSIPCLQRVSLILHSKNALLSHTDHYVSPGL